MEHTLPISSQLGPHLKALRKLRGMSQTDLGARVGVGQTRIADIEANPGLVSVDQLLKICRVLGAELVLRTTDKIELQAHATTTATATATLSPGPATVPLELHRERTELDLFADMIARSPQTVANAMETVAREYSLDLNSRTPLDEMPAEAMAPLASVLGLTLATFEHLLQATISRRNTYLAQDTTKGSW